MNTRIEITKSFDYAMLGVQTTSDDVQRLCEQAIERKYGGVCVPPCYVEPASEMLSRHKIPVGTVVGFPNGFSTKETKVFECRDAILNGASVIELFPNVGLIKKREYDGLQTELNAVRKALKRHRLLLVIETDLLSESEQISVSAIALSSKIDGIVASNPRSFDELCQSIKCIQDSTGGRMSIKAQYNAPISDTQTELLEQLGVIKIGISALAGGQGYYREYSHETIDRPSAECAQAIVSDQECGE